MFSFLRWLAVLALVAAACGDSAEDTTTRPATEETGAPATTAPPPETTPADDFDDAALPDFVLLLPEEEVVTGRVLILARQQNPDFDPARIEQVTFSFDGDRDTTQPIRTVAGFDADAEQLDPNAWQALWDTGDLDPGEYTLGVTLLFSADAEAPNELTVTRELDVNAAPVIEAVEADSVDGSTVVLDASAFDIDGTIAAWDWLIEEADVSADRSEARAEFEDLEREYPLILTVTDDDNATSSAYFTITFVDAKPVLAQDTSCICTCIKVRASGNALGPDGTADGTGWTKTADLDDGLTLGGLAFNPDNDSAGGEKKNTGFAFEVVAEVKGDPALCKETQLIKRTLTPSGAAAINKTYSGTGDRDLDGTNDMNITNMASCTAAGGQWNAGTGKCEFPESGTKYQPDGYLPSGGSLYDKEYTFKKHQGTTVLWYDTPYFSGLGNGSTYEADFVALLRGTDGKYCFVKFSVDASKNEFDDTESISPRPNAQGEILGKANQANVPGVP